MEDNFSTHTKIDENLTADEEVFISYSRVDKEFVGKIIRVLKSNGYSVWVDTESILPTSIWSSSIVNAIDNAAATIFVITDASLKSVECKKELDYAFEHGKKIIPLIIQNPGGLTLPEPLNSIQGIVWNTQSEEQANIDKIIAAIKLNLDWYNWHAGTLEQSQYWNKQSKNKHLLMQYHLLKIGNAIGYDVIAASNDRSKNCHGQSFSFISLQNFPKITAEKEVLNTIQLIDVLWFQKGTNRVIAAFEVEKSTSIYSGILRLADLSYSIADGDEVLYLVFPDSRERDVRLQSTRPAIRINNVPMKYIVFSDLHNHCDALCKFGYSK